MGSIEVMRALNDARVKTRHPLEVVIWTNEEGNHFALGTLGSGVAAGLLGPEILGRKDDQGLTLADWLRRYGQDPSHLTDARIPKGGLAAFIELHIEQGPHLDEAKIPIGIVQGIVGIKRSDCVVTGFANHAGTTPMNRRKDALAAASREVLAVRETVREENGHQVGTVGYMRAEPGAVNVVPGRAEFPVELRDLDAAKINRMWEHIQEKFKQIDKEENVVTLCKSVDDTEPAPTDPGLQAVIRDAAKSLGLATMDLPSEAGQDSQQIAKIAPIAMIFVPSRDGISHSPKEFTSWQDVANGAEVLYRVICFSMTGCIAIDSPSWSSWIFSTPIYSLIRLLRVLSVVGVHPDSSSDHDSITPGWPATPYWDYERLARCSPTIPLSMTNWMACQPTKP